MDALEFTEVSLDTDRETVYHSVDEGVATTSSDNSNGGSQFWNQYLAYHGYEESRAVFKSQRRSFSLPGDGSPTTTPTPNHIVDLEDKRYDKFDDTTSDDCSSLLSDSATSFNPRAYQETAQHHGNNNNDSKPPLLKSKSMPASVTPVSCCQDEESTSFDSACEVDRQSNKSKRSSLASIDGLLFELYDRHGDIPRPSFTRLDSSSTECSSLSEFQQKSDDDHPRCTQNELLKLEKRELEQVMLDLQNKTNQKNTQLVKCLRNREKHRNKSSKHCDIITAVLQAWSSKTSVDSRMKFSIEPVAGVESFAQWKDSVRALIRRPVGIPEQFRGKVWLSLASEYIRTLQLDWSKIVQFAFNDKCNPDDDALGVQIVKDLHRTGCSSFAGVENAEDRVLLQRVLLGYARWNKVTGYCQGFNILAALILRVTNGDEADALKVMVYLVDCVLPRDYFAHNLKALTVDMAVFRNYLTMRLPRLSNHLNQLQRLSVEHSTGVNVEPPLTNVFTMQWLLTAFATCLPRETVIRLWDCILLDGNEILIRVALVIWSKLAKHVIKARSADEFYMLMGKLTQDLLNGKIISTEDLIISIYKMAPLPLPKLSELREKYMYDITPFSAALHSASRTAAFNTDDEGDLCNGFDTSLHLDQTTIDVSLLKKQYDKLIHRQKQANYFLKMNPAGSQYVEVPIPPHASPVAMNHLFIGRDTSKQERSDTHRKFVKYQPDNTKKNSEERSVKAVCPAVTAEMSSRVDMYNQADSGSSNAGVNGVNGIRFKCKQPTNRRASHSPLLYYSESSPDDSSDEERKTPAKTKPIDFSVEPPRTQIDLSKSKLDRNRKRSTPNSPIKPAVRYPAQIFNPFPRPVTGLLSAKKAQHGIKLGLYKPNEAMEYMDTRAKKQLLERTTPNKPFNINTYTTKAATR